MSEYVLVPREDYVAICNEVRNKTGNMSLMKSGEVAPTIKTILTNEDVHLHAVEITPTGADITKYPDDGYQGFTQVKVLGDENLKAENIVAGVEIYGIVGSHECDVPDMPDLDLDLSPITVTPTGEEFTEFPDGDGFSRVTVEGDPNLRPENIAKGITIYGVTGTMTMGVLEDFPVEFQDKKDQADALYQQKFGAAPPDDFFMLASDGGSVTFGYMTEAFNITTFTPATMEFCAVGWKRVSFRSVTQDWATDDFTSTASTGDNYIKHIRYCTRAALFYNNVEVWPNNLHPFAFIYGGVQLPPMDFLADYPNALLSESSDSNFTVYAATESLYMSVSSNSGGELLRRNGSVANFYIKNGETAWRGGSTPEWGGTFTDYITPIWSNQDIYHTDGTTIYIEASDPVPVYA